MLDDIFTTTIVDTLTFGITMRILAAALVLGALISLVYIYSRRQEGYLENFIITLIMLPAIIAMIILLIGNNVARAFSLAGAFSLIRFRSAPGDSKDIMFVFFGLAAGLACGMGYIGYAALFTVTLGLVMLLLSKLSSKRGKSGRYMLKITMPEDMDYEGVFEDILNAYTSSYRLQKVRTVEFGSLFELSYAISMLPGKATKEFLDKLRCRNGNLTITLAMRDTGSEGGF